MAPTSHKGVKRGSGASDAGFACVAMFGVFSRGVSRASAGSIGGTNIIALTVTRPGSSISAVVDFAYKWADDSS